MSPKFTSRKSSHWWLVNAAVMLSTLELFVSVPKEVPSYLDVVHRQHINNVSDEPQWAQLSRISQSQYRNEALLELVRRYKVPDNVRRWPAAFQQ